jgi:hypothetical protein
MFITFSCSMKKSCKLVATGQKPVEGAMMSIAKRNWTAGFYAGFYWIGIVMTLGCLALVLAGNTELVWRFEHTAFPLSWAFGGAAVIAFLTAEFCDSAFSLSGKTEDRSPPEWETGESSSVIRQDAARA